MKTISAALAAHFATDALTDATCCRIQRTDGVVLLLTDHDTDIIVSGWTGDESQFNGTYLCALGFMSTNIESTQSLAVDNVEMHGILSSPSISEDDLRAGLWDFAAIELFRVNWADLTQGRLSQRRGWLGEVTLDERGAYRAELRGLMQAYSRTIGELTQPGCRALLGDARCKVVLNGSPGFVETGSLTGVSIDGLTLFDSSRSEAGPTGGIAITGISKANPGVVTLADGSTFSEGEAVMLSGIAGGVDFPTLNTSTIIRGLSGNTFTLPINTSAYTGTYSVSSGTCTPLGSESGYFDFGIITMTSGLNAGLSQEVRSYVPGQWTLELPFPYALEIADVYSMVAGCDKSLNTCKTKFANVVNFRGEPYLPGLDKIVQVGKQ